MESGKTENPVFSTKTKDVIATGVTLEFDEDVHEFIMGKLEPFIPEDLQNFDRGLPDELKIGILYNKEICGTRGTTLSHFIDPSRVVTWYRNRKDDPDIRVFIKGMYVTKNTIILTGHCDGKEMSFVYAHKDYKGDPNNPAIRTSMLKEQTTKGIFGNHISVDQFAIWGEVYIHYKKIQNQN